MSELWKTLKELEPFQDIGLLDLSKENLAKIIDLQDDCVNAATVRIQALESALEKAVAGLGKYANHLIGKNLEHACGLLDRSKPFSECKCTCGLSEIISELARLGEDSK